MSSYFGKEDRSFSQMSFDLLVESLEAPLDLGAQGPLASVFEVAREQGPFWASLGLSL
jgi:hypothetical protein